MLHSAACDPVPTYLWFVAAITFKMSSAFITCSLNEVKQCHVLRFGGYTHYFPCHTAFQLLTMSWDVCILTISVRYFYHEQSVVCWPFIRTWAFLWLYVGYDIMHWLDNRKAQSSSNISILFFPYRSALTFGPREREKSWATYWLPWERLLPRRSKKSFNKTWNYIPASSFFFCFVTIHQICLRCCNHLSRQHTWRCL